MQKATFSKSESKLKQLRLISKLIWLAQQNKKILKIEGFKLVVVAVNPRTKSDWSVSLHSFLSLPRLLGMVD